MTPQNVKLRGFAPDVDPMTSGIFADCNNIIPTVRGFAPLPSAVQLGSQVPQRCTGLFLGTLLSGESTLFAGTRGNLHSYSPHTNQWTSRSPADMTITQTYNRWRFDQFGNYTLAVNGVFPPLIYRGTSMTFEKVPDNPIRGSIVATVGLFVFLLAPENFPDQWACCGIGNVDAWTSLPSNQAVGGRLTHTPGPIKAGKRLGNGGDSIVVYKEKGVYIGQYVGPPFVWAFRLLSSTAGAVSHEAVVEVDDAHVVMAPNDFYLVDGGGAPRRIETPIRDWFFRTRLNQTYRGEVLGWWDQERDIVFWHYPSVDSSEGTLDSWIAWNRRTNNWTKGALQVQAVAPIPVVTVAGVTYDNFSTIMSTYGANFTESYQHPSITGVTALRAGVVLQGRQLATFSGVPTASEFTTSDMGDAANYWFLTRIRPHFAKVPTQALTVQMYRRDRLGDTIRQGLSAPLDFKSGWVNLRQSARLHRAQFKFTGGDYEMLSFDYLAQEAGTR